jgi:hypothetical protein
MASDNEKEETLGKHDRLRVVTAHVYVGLRPGARAEFDDRDETAWDTPVRRRVTLPRGFEYDKRTVEEITVRHFYGATMDEAVGIWRDEREGVIRETSIVITLINCCSWKEDNQDFIDRVFDLADDLYHSLQQDSVLVQIIEQDTDEDGEVELKSEFFEV